MATKNKNTATSDAEMIIALLRYGTAKEAVEKAGISPRALYDRMMYHDFMVKYSDTKSDIIRQAVFSINGKLYAAVDTIADIMTDTTVIPATRLQAAQMLLSNAGKITETLRDVERIASNFNANPFDHLEELNR